MKRKPLKYYLLLPYYALQLFGIILLLFFCGDDEDDEETENDKR